VQPELIFLKQLRCLLCREFTLNNVLSMWDYVLSGIEEEGRFFLQSKSKQANVYGEEDYFFNHLDALINLDYVCVAMIQYQRKALLESDYIDCLKVMMNYPKLECAADIIKISERVRKLLFDKQIKQHKQVLEVNTFPQMIEKQDYQFTCIIDNENDNSSD
jgi:hypothetical protein